MRISWTFSCRGLGQSIPRFGEVAKNSGAATAATIEGGDGWSVNAALVMATNAYAASGLSEVVL